MSESDTHSSTEPSGSTSHGRDVRNLLENRRLPPGGHPAFATREAIDGPRRVLRNEIRLVLIGIFCTPETPVDSLCTPLNEPIVLMRIIEALLIHLDIASVK